MLAQDCRDRKPSNVRWAGGARAEVLPVPSRTSVANAVTPVASLHLMETITGPEPYH